MFVVKDYERDDRIVNVACKVIDIMLVCFLA